MVNPEAIEIRSVAYRNEFNRKNDKKERAT